MAGPEELITIITEDVEAEAAAEDAETGAFGLEEASSNNMGGGGGGMQFSDRSHRTASQQHALPPQQERPRQSLAQQADMGNGGRKSSVRMSTQLLMPRQRRAGGAAGGGGGGGGSGRPSSPKLDNYLDEVPQPSRPRFSSSMSLEAQFAMMKSYESRLRSKILATNPEFANVLHVSPDLPAGLKRPNVSLKQRPATSREPAAATAGAAAGASQRRKTQRSQSLAPDRSQISEETQLDLARRLQYAQYLSDYFVVKQGDPCLNYGLLRDKKDFNPIKKFNWWSSWWSRDFQFQEEGAEDRSGVENGGSSVAHEV